MSNSSYRITVFPKPKFKFLNATLSKHQLAELKESGLPVSEAYVVASYLIKSEGGQCYSNGLLTAIAKALLVDPLVQTFALGDLAPQRWECDLGVEVGYKPTVTDNVATTFFSGLKDFFLGDNSLSHKARQARIQLLEQTKVRATKVYLFKLAKKTALQESAQLLEKFTLAHLANTLVENFSVRVSKAVATDSSFPKELYFLKKAPAPLEASSYYQAIPLSPPRSKTEKNPLKALTQKKAQLLKISKERLLALNLKEMLAIAKHYEKKAIQKERKTLGLPSEPTEVELEVLAQTWSEHCKHKIFNAKISYEAEGEKKRVIHSLFKTYLEKTTQRLRAQRKDLLSVFTDNAGMWEFNEKYALAMKVETHNSPSALAPFGGALTGLVGVNRDIIGTGIGVAPLFNTNVLCFAPPEYKNPLPGKLLAAKRVMRGVHRGVERGGNESGIPTVNGAMVFDERFIAKPLVFCGTGGIVKKQIRGRASHEKPLKAGDLVVMAGGRVGRDGLHGATFSSLPLGEESPSSAVQIGAPLTQKKLLDFILEARDLGLYKTLTDNGAGGLSSSVGELARLSGGAELHLEKVPLKMQGLLPWEILLSEAQERMTLVVEEKHQAELQKLARRHECEIAFIGTFTDSGAFSVFYKKTLVCHLQLAFLHEGVPTLELKACFKKEAWKQYYPKRQFKHSFSPPPGKFTALLRARQHGAFLMKMLRRPNITSKEAWVRQYDQEVKGKTILKPFDGPLRDAPLDAAVLKPLPNSYEGLAVASGLIPRYSDLDAYAMASGAIDEAVRNLIAVGTDPSRLVGLDNFSWPDPVATEEHPKEKSKAHYKLAQLVRACQAIKEVCLPYSLPLVSGKDSMKNDYHHGKKRLSVPPTLLFTALGKVPDIRKTVTSFFKEKDSLLYVLGETYRELGGSEGYAQLGHLGETVPVVRPQKNLKLYHALHQAIQKELLLACHDLSDGGLAVALSEAAFGGECGAEVDLAKLPLADAAATPTAKMIFEKLYSESQGRFLVEVARAKQALFETFLKQFVFRKKKTRLAFYRLGNTNTTKELVIRSEKKVILSEPLCVLRAAFKAGLPL